MKHIIYKAGGIITRLGKKEKEIYIIHRPRYDDWSLPKGHVEPEESMEQAALREVIEETGFECRIVRALEPYEYTLPNGNNSVVAFFEMHLERVSKKRDTESDRGEWIPLSRIGEIFSYPHQAAYIQRVLQ